MTYNQRTYFDNCYKAAEKLSQKSWRTLSFDSQGRVRHLRVKKDARVRIPFVCFHGTPPLPVPPPHAVIVRVKHTIRHPRNLICLIYVSISFRPVSGHRYHASSRFSTRYTKPRLSPFRFQSYSRDSAAVDTLPVSLSSFARHGVLST